MNTVRIAVIVGGLLFGSAVAQAQGGWAAILEGVTNVGKLLTGVIDAVDQGYATGRKIGDDLTTRRLKEAGNALSADISKLTGEQKEVAFALDRYIKSVANGHGDSQKWERATEATSKFGQHLAALVEAFDSESASLNQIIGTRLLDQLRDEFNAKVNVLDELRELPAPSTAEDVKNAQTLSDELEALAGKMRVLNESLDNYVKKFGAS